MKTNDDGGPAFPSENIDGMTLRDYFAGQALCATGMDIVNIMRKMPDASPTRNRTPDPDENRMIAAGLIARDAYRIADAMLKAREQ